jgi:hypothetical protein
MPRSILVALFAVVPLLSGCGGGQRFSPDVAAILEKADEIELYSLDPDRKTRTKTGGLRGWKVLGKTTLSGGEKKAIVQALQKGVADSDGSAAKCFNPRHGIVATHGGKTVELVICFECSSISGSIDGTRFSKLTAGGPAEVFNRMLEAKGVPLPKAKD